MKAEDASEGAEWFLSRLNWVSSMERVCKKWQWEVEVCVTGYCSDPYGIT